MLFTFEGPTVYTAAEEPALPTDHVPGMPSVTDVPGAGAVPSASDLPSAAETGIPALATAGVPELPGTGGLPPLPELGATDLSAIQGLGEGNNIGF
ncbi:hypothetical protein BJF78_25310 [Pseudonocardia sp. CNS-139]|nr:hypothetical protein BJF78_25310 [Pseudonocardia sp. CNS-139]